MEDKGVLSYPDYIHRASLTDRLPGLLINFISVFFILICPLRKNSPVWARQKFHKPLVGNLYLVTVRTLTRGRHAIWVLTGLKKVHFESFRKAWVWLKLKFNLIEINFNQIYRLEFVGHPSCWPLTWRLFRQYFARQLRFAPKPESGSSPQKYFLSITYGKHLEIK